MEQLNTHTINYKWQLTHDGTFDLAGEGREVFLQEGINWSYQGSVSPVLFTGSHPEGGLKDETAEPLS